MMPSLISINNHTEGAPIYIGQDEEHALNINDEGLFDKINNATEVRTVIQDARCLTAITNDQLEISGVKIRFSDDIWDFLPAKDDVHYVKSLYKYDFRKVKKNYYKTLLKLFVYSMICEYGIERIVNHACFLQACHLFDYLEQQNIPSLYACPENTIKQWIECKRITVQARSYVQYKTAIKNLMIFYYNVTCTPVDSDLLDYLNDLPDQRAELEANKLTLLPYEFMHSLCNLLFELFKNEEDPFNKRVIGLLCIATQSGLRPNELLNLETDCIEYETVDGMPVTKLRYRATKQRRGKGAMLVRTVANQKVVETVSEMLKACNSEDRVFSGGMNERTLNTALRSIIRNNAEGLHCVTDTPDPYFNGKPEEINVDGITQYINFPQIKQFRVYLASEYSRRGYDAYTIAKMLGHTDPKMLNYYERPATNHIQEDPVYTDTVLHDIVGNDLKILGPKGDIYQTRIRKFVEKDKFNVQPIDTAVNEIAAEMPIRQIPGGLCITPSINHPCELDNGKNADKLLCAYGLCKNQCHLYFHCAYHYNQFLTAIAVIRHNKEAGFKQQTEKEFNKLQTVLKTLLIPELQQLQVQIEKQGSAAVAQQHPEVKNIISDYDNVWKEVNLWANGTLKKLTN